MKPTRFFSLLTRTLLCALVFLSVLSFPALAQDAEYRLDLQRDFGYGNGSDVRGNFSMTIFGPQETIQAVTYRIDGQEMGRVGEAPFRFQFVTSNYPDGWHDLSAVVETTDGRQVTTQIVRVNFVSAAQQADFMKYIFGFVIVLLLVMVGVGAGSQFLAARGGKRLAPVTPRNYGLMGGTICPRCDRPYSIHFWSLSLIAGRLDRCDHCGKWAFVRRVSPDLLAAAERAELAAARAGETTLPASARETEEEKLRRLLDESKYGKL